MAPIDIQIYTVGGAVRDELLGLPVQDRDYVVVGASPEAMLAQGWQGIAPGQAPGSLRLVAPAGGGQP